MDQIRQDQQCANETNMCLQLSEQYLHYDSICCSSLLELSYVLDWINLVMILHKNVRNVKFFLFSSILHFHCPSNWNIS